VLAKSDRTGHNGPHHYVPGTAVLMISMSHFTRRMKKAQKKQQRRMLLRENKRCWWTISNITFLFCILWPRKAKKYTE